MQILGFILIGLGLFDFLASRVGIDIYAFVGIQLTGPAYTYSPLIAMGLGALLLTMTFGQNAKKLLIDYLGDDEQLVLFRSANIKNPGFFGRPKHGYLFVTDKRLGFLGDLPKAYKHLQTTEVDTHGIVWRLRDVTGVQRDWLNVTIAAHGQEVKLKTGALFTKQIADAIQSRL